MDLGAYSYLEIAYHADGAAISVALDIAEGSCMGPKETMLPSLPVITTESFVDYLSVFRVQLGELAGNHLLTNARAIRLEFEWESQEGTL